MTVTTTDPTDVDHSDLATLKELALAGGLEGEITVSCSSLGTRLDVSTQTASRRIRSLEDSDLLRRTVVGEGQRVRLTGEARRVLASEHRDYRTLFATDPGPALSGVVETGMGKGRHFVSLPGYVDQFAERLGYEPYPGTLNVRLDEVSARRYDALSAREGIDVDQWSDGETTYGAAVCYPATVSAAGERYDRTHVLVPDRSGHDEDLVELVAPVCLRDRLALSDGSEVSVRVTE
jgi:riboflavin kinase